MEWIFIIVLSLTTGYQAGKAGAKAEARENGGYCVPETLETKGCYKVTKTEDPKLINEIEFKED